MIGVERPSGWSALGFDCDPVPGDPVAVRAGAVSWTALADQISHCAQSLRALEAGASRGADSVAALLEARDEIVDQVGVMEARYRQAGAALEEYAVVLDRAQSESLRAWYAARDAQGELDAAVGRSESFTRSAQEAGAAGDDEKQARCTRLSGAAEADAACARGRIAAQQQVVTAAVEQRDAAAVRAMGLVSVALALVGLGALKGAARLGTAMCKGMLKHVEFLARAKGAASSVLGKVGLRALLRPGGVPAILRYRFRNAMVGQLGEESMLVGLWPKVRYRVPGLTATGAPRTGLPDLNISILGRTYMGEVKFLQAFTNKEKLVNQIIGYAHNAGEITADGLVHVFYPKFYTSSDSVVSFAERLSEREVVNVVFHPIEEYVGLRAATEINVTCQFGQGVNHYFSGWGG